VIAVPVALIALWLVLGLLPRARGFHRERAGPTKRQDEG